MNAFRHIFLIVAGLAWLAVAAPAQTNAPWDPAMVELLQQAAVETNVVADAGFDPSVLAVGATGLYRLVVTADPAAVKLPDDILIPSGLQMVKGGVGTSTAAGNQTSPYRTTLNFSVTPRAEGNFTIPGFSLSIGGRPVPVPARTLTVVAVDAPEARRPVRLRVEPPDGDFYVGQSIPLQIVAFDPGDHSLYGLVETKAEGDGFIFDRVKGSQRRELREEAGRSILAMIELINAVPIQEGTLTVSAQAFADRRFSGDAQDVQLPGYRPFLEAPAVELTVRHLPGGALPGFTGLIGKFSGAEPQPATREVHAGDPYDLRVVVTGTGNLARLTPPPVTNAPGWRVTLSPGSAGLTVSGNRAELHYTLIPQVPGMTATPVIPFSYFDPEENRYVDLTIPSIQVLVLPPVGGALAAGKNSLPEPAAPAEALGALAVKPVHYASTLRSWQQRPAFWCWQAVVGLTLGVWYSWLRRREYLAAHPEVVRFAQARRGLKRLNRQRQAAAEAGDAAKYLTLAVASLRVASAPQMNACADALVCDDVLSVLPPTEQTGPRGNLVRMIFVAGDELVFNAQSPGAEKVWAWKDELESLLAELRARLC